VVSARTLLWSSYRLALTRARALVRRDNLRGELYSGLETCVTYSCSHVSPSRLIHPRQRIKALVKLAGKDEVIESWIYDVTLVVTPIRYQRESRTRNPGCYPTYLMTPQIYLSLTQRYALTPAGRGLAKHLLRLLHYAIADPSTLPTFPSSWGSPPPPLPSDLTPLLPKAIASILWSEVGSTFYDRASIGEDLPGWVVRDCDIMELRWSVSTVSTGEDDEAARSTGPVGSAGSGGDAGGAWELFYDDQLPSVVEYLSKARAHSLVTTQRAQTAFAPDPASPGTISFVRLNASTRPPPVSLDTTIPQPVGARWRAHPPVPAQPDTTIINSSSSSDPDPSKTYASPIVLFALYNHSISRALLLTYTHGLNPTILPSLLDTLDPLIRLGDHMQGLVWGLEWDSELVQAWKAERRNVSVKRRNEGKGSALLGVARYGCAGMQAEAVQGMVLGDTQMWLWCRASLGSVLQYVSDLIL
jgi:hypothetical protein